MLVFFTFMVELHGLVEFSALLKVHGTLDHQRRCGLQSVSEKKEDLV